MTNYLVHNTNHGFDLVNISHDNNTIIVRLFVLYSGPLDNVTIIPSDNLQSNMNEYPGGSILTYNGTNYRLIWYRNMNYDQNQLQPGGTYAVVTNNQFEYIVRLDSEKYPDIDIGDWKYLRTRSLRPIFKFTIVSDHQSWSTINKVGYLNSNIGSTVFVTGDEFGNETHDDKDVTTLPLFTTNVTELDVNNYRIDVSTNTLVNGQLRFINKNNVTITDIATITNGTCSVTCTTNSQTGSVDVLFGFNKVATVQL